MDGRRSVRVAGWLLLALAAACAPGGQGTDAADAGPEALPEATRDEPAPSDALEPEVELAALEAGPDLAPEVAGPCDRLGFQVVSAKGETSLATEGGFLAVAASDSLTQPADVFGLELLLDQRELGPYDFTDENYATCERCARIDAECLNQGGCRKIFLVYAGHLEIGAWDDPGGRFTATITGLRAREVTIAASLPMTSTPVEGGETWCVDELTLDVAPLAKM